jgi:hypothetical protein
MAVTCLITVNSSKHVPEVRMEISSATLVNPLLPLFSRQRISLLVLASEIKPLAGTYDRESDGTGQRCRQAYKILAV